MSCSDKKKHVRFTTGPLRGGSTYERHSIPHTYGQLYGVFREFFRLKYPWCIESALFQIHYQCIQINKDQIYQHPITEWLTWQNLIQNIENMPPLLHRQVKMATKREKSTDRSPNLISSEGGHDIPWSFSGCTLTTFRMDYVTGCEFSEFDNTLTKWNLSNMNFPYIFLTTYGSHNLKFQNFRPFLLWVLHLMLRNPICALLHEVKIAPKLGI